MKIRCLVAIACIAFAACTTPEEPVVRPPDAPPTDLMPAAGERTTMIDAPNLAVAFGERFPGAEAATVPDRLRIETRFTHEDLDTHVEVTITAVAARAGAEELPRLHIVTDSADADAPVLVDRTTNALYDALADDIENDLALAAGVAPEHPLRGIGIPCVTKLLAFNAEGATLIGLAAAVASREAAQCTATASASSDACVRQTAALETIRLTGLATVATAAYSIALQSLVAAMHAWQIGNAINAVGGVGARVVPAMVGTASGFVALAVMYIVMRNLIPPILVNAGIAASAGKPGDPALRASAAAFAAGSSVYQNCTMAIVLPLWANGGVGLVIVGPNPAPPAGGGGGGGGAGGGGGPPPPGGNKPNFFDGPSLPGLGSDDTRYFLSNLFTALPDDLARANKLEVDLQAPVSPWNGVPMNNQRAPFDATSQTENWGVSMCTALRVDANDGGPYDVPDPAYFVNGFRLQEAHAPFWVNSGQCGSSTNPLPCIGLHGSTLPVPTITMRRVCDGDDDNDAIPDALQGGFPRCYDPDGDGLEDLWSISLDSEMPNRFENHTTNCNSSNLDLALHYQDGQQPGKTALQLMAEKDGAEVSQEYQVYTLTEPYADDDGEPIGTGTMVRWRVHGTLHRPADPCFEYLQTYDPSTGATRWKWMRTYSRPGCELGGGGGFF